MDDIVYQDQTKTGGTALAIKQKILQLFNCGKAKINFEFLKFFLNLERHQIFDF